MKNLIKEVVTTFGFFSFILMVVSCNRNDEYLVPSDRNNDDKHHSLIILDEFEKYGISHNLYLDYTAGMSNFNTASRESIMSYSNGYSDAHFTCQAVLWEEHDAGMNYVYELIENPESLTNSLLTNNFIDSSEIIFVNMLHAILLGSIDEDNQVYQSLTSFRNSIATLENYIRNNYNIVYDDQSKSGNSAARFLAACSIAKYSYAYWISAATDTSHPWYTRLNNRKTYEFDGSKVSEISNRSFWGKIARGIKVAAADVWGFVAAEGCGFGYMPGGYDLECAWGKAGNKSSDAGDRHDSKYGGN